MFNIAKLYFDRQLRCFCFMCVKRIAQAYSKFSHIYREQTLTQFQGNKKF